MWDFGDGREERMDAMLLEIKLRNNPEVTRRRNAYWSSVKKAKEHALSIGNASIIEELILHNQAYIRSLLETEDERFGAGSLADRYAHTFYKRLGE